MAIDPNTIISLITALIKIYKFKKNEAIYFALSIHAKGISNDKYLLGDEHKNNYYKPIGGVIVDKTIFDEINDNFLLQPSKLKARNIEDYELAFEVGKYKKRLSQMTFWRNKFIIIAKIINKHLTNSILIDNIIREIREEYKIQLNEKHFDINKFTSTYEIKKYHNDIARIHVYISIKLTKPGQKRLMDKSNIKELSITNRSKGKNIVSDLAYIYKISSPFKLGEICQK